MGGGRTRSGTAAMDVRRTSRLSVKALTHKTQTLVGIAEEGILEAWGGAISGNEVIGEVTGGRKEAASVNEPLGLSNTTGTPCAPASNEEHKSSPSIVHLIRRVVKHIEYSTIPQSRLLPCRAPGFHTAELLHNSVCTFHDTGYVLWLRISPGYLQDV